MVNYIVFLILGLVAGTLGIYFSTFFADLIPSEIEKKVKVIRVGQGFDEHTIPVIPLLISVFLIEASVVYLVSTNVLVVGIWSIILGIIGLLVFGAIVGFLSLFLFMKIALAMDADARKSYEEIKASVRAYNNSVSKEKRRYGKPGTKVYRCGLCGEISPTGNFASTSSGMVFCERHAHLADRFSLQKSYECPSCGYKFAPKDNSDYFDKHLCSNCQRHLDDSSWE